jgi:hypothetical protein
MKRRSADTGRLLVEGLEEKLTWRNCEVDPILARRLPAPSRPWSREDQEGDAHQRQRPKEHRPGSPHRRVPGHHAQEDGRRHAEARQEADLLEPGRKGAVVDHQGGSLPLSALEKDVVGEWKRFEKGEGMDLLIIVTGVLMALGAQGAVQEWSNRQHEHAFLVDLLAEFRLNETQLHKDIELTAAPLPALRLDRLLLQVVDDEQNALLEPLREIIAMLEQEVGT